MNMLFNSKLLSTIISAALLSSVIYTPAISATSPPPVAITVPMIAPLDAQWIVVTKVQYKNGKIRNCETRIFNDEPENCSKWLSAQEIVELRVGKGNTAIGITPLVTEHGRQPGVVIYYKTNV